jgi:hypothetical protein
MTTPQADPGSRERGAPGRFTINIKDVFQFLKFHGQFQFFTNEGAGSVPGIVEIIMTYTGTFHPRDNPQ